MVSDPAHHVALELDQQLDLRQEVEIGMEREAWLRLFQQSGTGEG